MYINARVKLICYLSLIRPILTMVLCSEFHYGRHTNFRKKMFQASALGRFALQRVTTSNTSRISDFTMWRLIELISCYFNVWKTLAKDQRIIGITRSVLDHLSHSAIATLMNAWPQATFHLKHLFISIRMATFKTLMVSLFYITLQIVSNLHQGLIQLKPIHRFSPTPCRSPCLTPPITTISAWRTETNLRKGVDAMDGGKEYQTPAPVDHSLMIIVLVYTRRREWWIQKPFVPTRKDHVK